MLAGDVGALLGFILEVFDILITKVTTVIAVITSEPLLLIGFGVMMTGVVVKLVKKFI